MIEGIGATLLATMLIIALRVDWRTGQRGAGFLVKLAIAIAAVNMYVPRRGPSSEFLFGVGVALLAIGGGWLALRLRRFEHDLAHERERRIQRQEWEEQERAFRASERAYREHLPRPRRLNKRDRKRRKRRTT
ncbi:hypothetical protein LDO31_15090 [Luteimonas sp. XNQY3]|nr:hypothetical protein [Luteimonas sp. XNQY3]MCD9007539.1 hypothetical protein [Luteimonas sp. XNQY3]